MCTNNMNLITLMDYYQFLLYTKQQKCALPTEWEILYGMNSCNGILYRNDNY